MDSLHVPYVTIYSSVTRAFFAPVTAIAVYCRNEALEMLANRRKHSRMIRNKSQLAVRLPEDLIQRLRTFVSEISRDQPGLSLQHVVEQALQQHLSTYAACLSSAITPVCKLRPGRKRKPLVHEDDFIIIDD